MTIEIKKIMLDYCTNKEKENMKSLYDLKNTNDEKYKQLEQRYLKSISYYWERKVKLEALIEKDINEYLGLEDE